MCMHDRSEAYIVLGVCSLLGEAAVLSVIVPPAIVAVEPHTAASAWLGLLLSPASTPEGALLTPRSTPKRGLLHIVSKCRVEGILVVTVSLRIRGMTVTP